MELVTWAPWGSGPSLCPGSGLCGRSGPLWTGRTGGPTGPVSSGGHDRKASQQSPCSSLCFTHTADQNNVIKQQVNHDVVYQTLTCGSCSGHWCWCWHHCRRWVAGPGRRACWRRLLRAETTGERWVEQKSCHHHTCRSGRSSYWRRLRGTHSLHQWPEGNVEQWFMKRHPQIINYLVSDPK